MNIHPQIFRSLGILFGNAEDYAKHEIYLDREEDGLSIIICGIFQIGVDPEEHDVAAILKYAQNLCRFGHLRVV